MRQIVFYLRYALNHLRRSGHWTTFAVFCVAAGVATVVALRSLGLAITDSLLSNLRLYNHGDINLSTVGSFGPFSFAFQSGDNERSIFPDGRLRQIEGWARANDARLTACTFASNIQIALPGKDQAGRPQFTSSYLIDPTTYALVGDIRALDPPAVALRDLFTGGPEVVISQNLAQLQKIKVGDRVRVSGTETPFTVRGIVPTETEAGINNLLAAFFGFAYFDIRQAPTMQLNSQPNSIGMVLADGVSDQDIEAAAIELRALSGARRVQTTPWLLARNQEVSDMIGRFIVAMGLGAMLIGGVGIMNTMLVLVGRRAMEIATLKTFGLKGRQVVALFVAEAFLLGLIGSLLGVVIGLLLSGAVNRYGEAFLQQRLPWRLHGEAIVYGLVLGLVVTLVFGVLPVLTTTKVRPGIILRPNETHLPHAGILQSLLALLVVIVALGIIAGQIMGPVLVDVAGRRAPNPTLVGILGVMLTLLFLGLLVALLWAVVWFIGRLPTLGNVDLRLALRNLATRRLRTATTLLALTAGMFALSSITFLGLGAREVVRFQFSETLGGNVIVVPLLPPRFAQPLVDLSLSSQPGIEYKTVFSAGFGLMTAVDGKPILLKNRQRSVPLTLLTRDTNNPALRSGRLLAGRDLTPDDRSKPVVVLSEQSVLEGLVKDYQSLQDLGVKVGSRIRLRYDNRVDYFEVVGIVGNINGLTPNVAGAYLPPGILRTDTRYPVNIVQIRSEHVSEVMTALSALPLVFVLDATFIDGLLRRLIDQMAAIPTLVGLLSLLAAAVIMANTVSLATLERRRQIGILKAMGLKRRRVLRVMLLENTVIGLLGSLLGIGISILGVSLMTAVGAGIAIPMPREAAPITIGLISASVIIAWVATLLSARSAVDERVARVLRYE
jgi:ABC-type antimicrobial peptide transport system permease subunit